jgi:hypothetical protein
MRPLLSLNYCLGAIFRNKESSFNYRITIYDIRVTAVSPDKQYEQSKVSVGNIRVCVGKYI